MKSWGLRGNPGAGCTLTGGVQPHRSEHSGQSGGLATGSINSPQPWPLMSWHSSQEQKEMGPETGWRQSSTSHSGDRWPTLRYCVWDLCWGQCPGQGWRPALLSCSGAGTDGPGGMKWWPGPWGGLLQGDTWGVINDISVQQTMACHPQMGPSQSQE